MFKTEIKREKIRICEATKINDPDIRSAIPVATTSESAGRTAPNRENAQKALKPSPYRAGPSNARWFITCLIRRR